MHQKKNVVAEDMEKECHQEWMECIKNDFGAGGKNHDIQNYNNIRKAKVLHLSLSYVMNWSRRLNV